MFRNVPHFNAECGNKNASEVRNFRWFCFVNEQLAMCLRRVKRSVICKFHCFCPFDIQQWSVLLLSPSQKSSPLLTPFLKGIQPSVNCYHSVLIFHQNAKTITVRYIYSTWRNVPKPSKKCSLLTSTLTLPRRHFWAYFSKFFSILLFFQYWL